VQNFINCDSFKGAKIKFEQNSPERGSHGATHGLGVIGGVGNLATDGWNVYAPLDYQTKSALLQGDRPEGARQDPRFRGGEPAGLPPPCAHAARVHSCRLAPRRHGAKGRLAETVSPSSRLAPLNAGESVLSLEGTVMGRVESSPALGRECADHY
jgi:hypothetical protein